MLEDERNQTKFVGNAAMWDTHCSSTLKQQCDPGSMEADPKLDTTFTPVGCRWGRRGRGHACLLPLAATQNRAVAGVQ